MLVLALAAGCSSGGSDDGDEGGGDTRGGDDKAQSTADDDLARDSLLTLEDLPFGWHFEDVPGDIGEVIGEQVPACAETAPSGGPEPTGRAGPRSFTDDVSRLDQEIRVYDDADAAEEVLATIRATDPTSCIQGIVVTFGGELGTDLGESQVNWNPDSGFGDGSASATVTSPTSPLVVEFSWLRVGREVASIVIVTPDPAVFDIPGRITAAAEAMAAAQDG